MIIVERSGTLENPLTYQEYRGSQATKLVFVRYSYRAESKFGLLNSSALSCCAALRRLLAAIQTDQ